jgi:branched-subunit amino acid ABC-type transport system permease component
MKILEGSIVYSNFLFLPFTGLMIIYILKEVLNFAKRSMMLLGIYVSFPQWLVSGLHPYYSLPLPLIFECVIEEVWICLRVLRPLIKKETALVLLMTLKLAVNKILIGVFSMHIEKLKKRENQNLALKTCVFKFVMKFKIRS